MPLNIDWQQILLHMLNVVLLGGGLYFLLYQPVKDFMDARDAQYAKREQEAQELFEQAQREEETIHQRLAEVEQECQERQKASALALEQTTARQLQEAEEQAEKLLADARRRAEKERSRMLEQSREEIAALAADATEKLLAASHKDACDRFLDAIEKSDDHE